MLVILAKTSSSKTKWVGHLAWSISLIWAGEPIALSKKWEKELTSISRSYWETSRTRYQRPSAASWWRNRRRFFNLSCTIRSTAIPNWPRHSVSQPESPREETHSLPCSQPWRTPWRYCRGIQSKCASIHNSYHHILFFYSISANTIGDDELEAALRQEAMAQRNQSINQNPRAPPRGGPQGGPQNFDDL